MGGARICVDGVISSPCMRGGCIDEMDAWVCVERMGGDRLWVPAEDDVGLRVHRVAWCDGDMGAPRSTDGAMRAPAWKVMDARMDARVVCTLFQGNTLRIHTTTKHAS